MADDHMIERFEADLRALFPLWKQAGGLRQGRLPAMISTRGAVGAAERLLMSPELSPGFIALRDGGRLDLTVERLILRLEHGALFTPAQRGLARRMLVENGFPGSELPLEPYE